VSNSQDKAGVEKYLLVLLVAGLAGFSLYLYLRADAVRGETGFIWGMVAMFIAWFDVLLGFGTIYIVRKYLLLALVTSLALAVALFVGIYVLVTVAI